MSHEFKYQLSSFINLMLVNIETKKRDEKREDKRTSKRDDKSPKKHHDDEERKEESHVKTRRMS